MIQLYTVYKKNGSNVKVDVILTVQYGCAMELISTTEVLINSMGCADGST